MYLNFEEDFQLYLCYLVYNIYICILVTIKNLLICRKVMKKILLLIVIFYLFTEYSNSKSKINLGNSVNSICNEISPIVSSNGDSLFFCRSFCRGNIGNDDIWISELDENNEWSRAKNSGKQLNLGKTNFVTSVFANGNKLLLGSSFDNNGKQIQGASVVTKTENGWSKPINITIKNFVNNSKTNGFFLSNDSKILLMTLNNESSYGEKDIFVSFLENGYNYSEPFNLGDLINTKGDEISPFLANDGVTLYFSTDGRSGFGNADIYMSTRLDSTWMNWSEPINLGKDINSEGWDAFFKLSPKGDIGYFASNVESYGESDIFFAKLPEKIRPKTVSLVHGSIRDAKTMKPMKALVELFSYPEKKRYSFTYSNSNDGTYELSLPVRDIWTIKISNDDYFSQDYIIDLSLIDTHQVYIRDISLSSKLDTLFFMRNILFEFAQTNNKLNKSEEISILLKFLEHNNDYVIEVVGHSDSIGSPKNNERISLDRAKKAAEVLMNFGISKNRIIISGQSFFNPIAPNDTEEGRALNRRVEFYLRKKQQ